MIDFVSVKNDHNSPKIIYGTSHRNIAQWDARQKQDSWKIKVEINDGLLSALALPNCESLSHNNPTWLAYGTLRGAHVIWDLRYHMMATKLTNSDNRGVTTLNLIDSCGPSMNGETYKQHSDFDANSIQSGSFINNESAPISSWPRYLASSLDGCNIINFFDIEKRELEAQIISDPEKNDMSEELPHFTSCQFYGKNNRKLITAGTDRIVRYWDFDDYKSSYVIIDAPHFRAGSSTENNPNNKYFIPPQGRTYECRIQENLRVLQEFQIKRKNPIGATEGTGRNGRIVDGDVRLTGLSSNSNFNKNSPDDRFIINPLPHVDAISDMCLINVSTSAVNHNIIDNHKHWEQERAPNGLEVPLDVRNENFFVTASRDGWISVWR